MLASVVTALLEVDRLVRAYAFGRGFGRRPHLAPVLHGVSLTIPPAGALGLVGESGSGKSTLARCVLALERPQGGTVRLEGVDLFALAPDALKAMRRRMQAVFQDPNGSLDPRMTIGRIVAEPVAALEPGASRSERRARVAAALEAVGLPGSQEKYPHAFSGGQRQRIAIARALVTGPALVVADEPVSALDVSVQAQILRLIDRLRADGIGWLFISHDLAVVRAVCDDVVVLLRGHVVEQGPAASVFAGPAHPYTRALVAAVPHAGALRESPAPDEPVPGGCPYAGACRLERPECRMVMPALRDIGGRAVACHAVTA